MEQVNLNPTKYGYKSLKSDLKPILKRFHRVLSKSRHDGYNCYLCT